MGRGGGGSENGGRVNSRSFSTGGLTSERPLGEWSRPGRQTIDICVQNGRRDATHLSWKRAFIPPGGTPLQASHVPGKPASQLSRRPSHVCFPKLFSFGTLALPELRSRGCITSPFPGSSRVQRGERTAALFPRGSGLSLRLSPSIPSSLFQPPRYSFTFLPVQKGEDLRTAWMPLVLVPRLTFLPCTLEKSFVSRVD